MSNLSDELKKIDNKYALYRLGFIAYIGLICGACAITRSGSNKCQIQNHLDANKIEILNRFNNSQNIKTDLSHEQTLRR